jgi:copper(I)-binding protein
MALMLALLAALLFVQDPILLESPIVVAGPSTGDDVAGYVRIANPGPADRLIAVECVCAERVEIHQVTRANGKVSMDALPALDLPAGSTVEIRPGSPLHLMLMGLKAPLPTGSKVVLTLHFERADKVTREFAVVADSRAAWVAKAP